MGQQTVCHLQEVTVDVMQQLKTGDTSIPLDRPQVNVDRAMFSSSCMHAAVQCSPAVIYQLQSILHAHVQRICNINT